MEKTILKSFTFGYDLEAIEMVMDYVKANFKEDDYEMWIGYGDDIMNGLDVFNEEMLKDRELQRLIWYCDGEGRFKEEE